MSVDLAAVTAALESLRKELAHLAERLAALEAGNGAATQKSAPPARSAEQVGLSDELVVVISAAIAAFLGKKPHIRQIRLVGGESWAQQGRATIQTSHVFGVLHS